MCENNRRIFTLPGAHFPDVSYVLFITCTVSALLVTCGSQTGFQIPNIPIPIRRWKQKRFIGVLARISNSSIRRQWRSIPSCLPRQVCGFWRRRCCGRSRRQFQSQKFRNNRLCKRCLGCSLLLVGDDVPVKDWQSY